MNHIPCCRALAIPVAFYFPWSEKTKTTAKSQKKIDANMAKL